MIPKLFSECNVSKGFVHSRLRRYVPHRIGVEFECYGVFANNYLHEIGYNGRINKEFIKKKFNLTDFSEDFMSSIKPSIEDINHWRTSPSDFSNEIRVSIQDYRQLTGLYNIMNEMAKYCVISEGSGIHIHVDLTKYGKNNQKNAAVNWFNRHLSEVESIFPKYTGSYNKRIAKRGKSSYVNVSLHDTVEFRIAPLTFDYEVLITWIVKCSKLVSRMISECHLDKISNKSKTKNWKASSIGVGDSGYIASDVRNDGLLSPNHLPHLDARMYDDLRREDIDWWIDGGYLMMNFPDGITVRCRLERAVSHYNSGGMDLLLRASDIIGRESRNTWSSYTTASGSGTLTTYGSNYDYWSAGIDFPV